MHLCRNISASCRAWSLSSRASTGFIYGPRYRRARQQAFARSRGICQCCGRRRATQAHHWAQRYLPDDKITAVDLTAVCGPCHWLITFRCLLERVGDTGVWVILATALESRYPGTPRGERSAGGRRRVARRHPRSCRAPERTAATRPVPDGPDPDLRSLVQRCRHDPCWRWAELLDRECSSVVRRVREQTTAVGAGAGRAGISDPETAELGRGLLRQSSTLQLHTGYPRPAARVEVAHDGGFCEAHPLVETAQSRDWKDSVAQSALDGRFGTSQHTSEFAECQYVGESFQASEGVLHHK